MNYNHDSFNGEFLPYTDTNFKIPLRNDNRKKTDNSTEIFSSPLAAVCHDQPAPPGADGYPNNYSGSNTFAPALNPFEMNEKRADLKRRALDAEFIQSKSGLPPELTKMLQPLFCELCSAKMNSSISAKNHYESKQHDKKVNAWLQDWSKETGEPIPKREKPKEGPVGPNAFHCEICDLPLTSLQHASQHYMGKKHRLALAGRTNPSGSGYYGEDGKWIRTNTKPTLDPSGRFHIGTSFKQAQTITPAAAATTAAVSENANTITTESKPQTVVHDPEKYCKICDISVTSAPQMKAHLIGTKHAKKLKLLGEPPHSSKNDTILNSLEQQSGVNSAGEIDHFSVASIPLQHSNKRDNSIYRTPSGSYYCQPCDVTITTEVVFNQHLDSKKHIKTIKMFGH